MPKEIKSEDISAVTVTDFGQIDVVCNVKARRSSYDVWLLQGADTGSDDCSQIFVAEHEIDEWITGLQRAKIVIAAHKEQPQCQQ